MQSTPRCCSMFDFMIFVHLSFFCSDKNKVTIVFKSVGVVSNVRHEICFQDVTLNPNQMFFKWIDYLMNQGKIYESNFSIFIYQDCFALVLGQHPFA